MVRGVAREKANLTQLKVCKSGIVRSNRLSQIEIGKTPICTDEFLALCKLYKTTPDIVLGLGPRKTASVTHLNLLNSALGNDVLPATGIQERKK